jgi:hypothetical protein
MRCTSLSELSLFSQEAARLGLGFDLYRIDQYQIYCIGIISDYWYVTVVITLYASTYILSCCFTPSSSLAQRRYHDHPSHIQDFSLNIRRAFNDYDVKL